MKNLSLNKIIVTQLQNIVLISLISIVLISCNNEIALIEEEKETITDVEKMIRQLSSENFATFEDAVLFFEENVGYALTNKSTRSESVSISEKAAIALDRMENVEVTIEMTLEDYRQELLAILYSSNLDADDEAALYVGIEATIAVIEYKRNFPNESLTTRWFGDALRCLAGTVGSAGIGSFAGAGVGTVVLPVVGTVSGVAMGAFYGALVGAATFC